MPAQDFLNPSPDGLDFGASTHLQRRNVEHCLNLTRVFDLDVFLKQFPVPAPQR
jgi:hypothetical protein